jgi:hypothetical protein
MTTDARWVMDVYRALDGSLSMRHFGVGDEDEENLRNREDGKEVQW